MVIHEITEKPIVVEYEELLRLLEQLIEREQSAAASVVEADA